MLPLGPGEPPFVPLALKTKGPEGTGVLAPSGAGDAAAEVTRELPFASLSSRERKFIGLSFSFEGVDTSGLPLIEPLPFMKLVEATAREGLMLVRIAI